MKARTLKHGRNTAQEDDADVVDEESFRRLVNRVVDARDTNLFLRHLATGNVLFCPGADDWDAVARLSDVTRVFVFAPGASKPLRPDELSLESCPSALRDLFLEGAQGNIESRDVTGAPVLDGMGGHYLRLARNIEIKGKVVVSRKLMIVVLPGDPADVYTTLFVKSGIAPAYVSLDRDMRNRFSEMLLNAGVAAPVNLITDGDAHLGPWTWKWRELHAPDRRTIFRRRTDQAHRAVRLYQADSVTFTTREMTPVTIQGAHAVILRPSEYLAYFWVGEQLRILIDSKDDGLVADLRRYDPRIEQLAIGGLPLRDAAALLAQACPCGEWRIHARWIGFNDEADALWQSWSEAHPNLWLTIHATAAEFESTNYSCGDLE